MQKRIEIYISKRYKEYFDQLKAMSDISGESMASLIGDSIEQYIRNINEDPHIIIDQKRWDKLLNKKSKKDLLDLDTLITKLNRKIIEKLCKK